MEEEFNQNQEIHKPREEKGRYAIKRQDKPENFPKSHSNYHDEEVRARVLEIAFLLFVMLLFVIFC